MVGGGREEGREGGREGWNEGGREGGREGRNEGGKEETMTLSYMTAAFEDPPVSICISSQTAFDVLGELKEKAQSQLLFS